MPNRNLRSTGLVDRLKRLCLTFGLAAIMLVSAPIYDPRGVGYATPTPGEISTRIEQLTGLTPAEIDQIYAAEQAANLLLIAYDVIDSGVARRTNRLSAYPSGIDGKLDSYDRAHDFGVGHRFQAVSGIAGCADSSGSPTGRLTR